MAISVGFIFVPLQREVREESKQEDKSNIIIYPLQAIKLQV